MPICMPRSPKPNRFRGSLADSGKVVSDPVVARLNRRATTTKGMAAAATASERRAMQARSSLGASNAQARTATPVSTASNGRVNSIAPSIAPVASAQRVDVRRTARKPHQRVTAARNVVKR
jgi:hypothetical protein